MNPALDSRPESAEASPSLVDFAAAAGLDFCSLAAGEASASPGFTQITGSAGASRDSLALAASGFSWAIADCLLEDCFDFAFAGCADNEETGMSNRHATKAKRILLVR
jgi:hypothetical protein